MAEPQNFRSAFNGFNREDVVHYIEYTNARHETQLSQLRGELQAAQEEANRLRGAQKTASDPAVTEELVRLRARCTVLEAENAALRAAQTAPAEAPASLEDGEELARLRLELEQAIRERDEALEQVRQAQSRAEEELAAYRRAERMERMARERVAQVYHQANGTLADAGARLDAAADSLTQAADQAAARLSALQDAIRQSEDVLREAAGILTSMNPETEAE